MGSPPTAQLPGQSHVGVRRVSAVGTAPALPRLPSTVRTEDGSFTHPVTKGLTFPSPRSTGPQSFCPRSCLSHGKMKKEGTMSLNSQALWSWGWDRSLQQSSSLDGGVMGGDRGSGSPTLNTQGRVCLVSPWTTSTVRAALTLLSRNK